jgi:hypothetical protein
MAPDIATNMVVGPAAPLEFVRPRHRAILLTTRANSRPPIRP